MFQESNTNLSTENFDTGQDTKCCKFFALNRWCRYGSRCRFLHEANSSSWNNYNQLDSSDPRKSRVYRNSTRPFVTTTEPQEGESSTAVKYPSPCSTTRTEQGRRYNSRNGRNDIGYSNIPDIPHYPYNGPIPQRFQRTAPNFNWRQTPFNVDRSSRRQVQQPRVCRYFSNGNCSKGDKCQYLHQGVPRQNLEKRDLSNQLPDNRLNHNDVEEHILDTVGPEVISVPKTPCVKEQLLLKDLDAEQLARLRDTEIAQLKKRFPKNNIVELEENKKYAVVISSTDPDWPYDIKEVKMEISFPFDYPKAPPETIVRNEDNEALPPNLLRHLSTSVTNWFSEKHQDNIVAGLVQLTFRPFLRWFDRNLEDLFTNGLRKEKFDVVAKAAGLEFVPFEQLPGFNIKDDESSIAESSAENQENTNSNKTAFTDVSAECISSDTANQNDKSIMPLNLEDLKTAKKGTEIKLRNLQFGENVAMVACQKLRLTIQCSRCKTRHDISVEPRRRNVIHCTKCHNVQQIAFRPSMLLSVNTTLGYLDIDSCQAFDLLLMDCIFAVECLTCSKQMSTDGIHYGQIWSTWCHNCNSKLSIYVDSAKFQILQPSGASENVPVNHIKLERKDKKVKDPAIQEGKPLPDCGACKHFKKSFRWFRFPCCGKAYPCDECHNEKELEHEMKLANRVICGFCAVEQPYTSSKPCVSCASSMTNMSKAHWEGGKGCRDKVKMSKDDRQKYSGVSKTVSRKVKEQKEKKEKVKVGK